MANCHASSGVCSIDNVNRRDIHLGWNQYVQLLENVSILKLIPNIDILIDLSD